MDKIIANAEESGYRLLERADFRSAEHRVGGVKGTREALKWILQPRKVKCPHCMNVVKTIT